jgi:hypothetical protein
MNNISPQLLYLPEALGKNEIWVAKNDALIDNENVLSSEELDFLCVDKLGEQRCVAWNV